MHYKQITMNKEEMIQAHLQKPYEVGEKVLVQGLGSQDKSAWSNSSIIKSLVMGGIFIESSYRKGADIFIEDGCYKKYTKDVGYNPMSNKPWNSSLRIVNFSLGSILYGIGWERNREGDTYYDRRKELNWNPTINGVVYQRELCWHLYQKQALIDSIYNYINIGMIIIKRNSYPSVDKKVENGEIGYFKDIVDGKQRLDAILGFVNNIFPDSEGVFWKDFSDQAQSRFLDFMSLSYGEIGEEASDQDVKDVFLGVNFTGTPMSPEHVEFVKSIKIK